MSNSFWQQLGLKATSALLGTAFLAASSPMAMAQSVGGANPTDDVLQQISDYNEAGEQPLDQVTSVFQLRDVSPRDWAYEALRSLVERYGCIEGYPNRTFRGNRALSRFEFAAGLNACMQQIERLIASTTSILREDITRLQRLVREFEAELAALGARVDNLEGRVAFLEDHQFSTTTKLRGEVIFATITPFGADEIDGEDTEEETTFSNRVRLNFDTSFTGKDRLRVRLQSGNVPDLSDFNGSDSTRVGFDTTGDDDDPNDVATEDLYYRFPVGDRLRVWVGTEFDPNDVFDVHNPFLASSGSGALSRFPRRDPLVFRGQDSGAGLAFKYDITDKIDARAIYVAPDAADPTAENGLFNGNFSTGAQVNFEPTDRFSFGVTFLHVFETAGDANISGSTLQVGNPEITDADAPFGDVPTRSERIGVAGSWRASDLLNFSFFASYANINATDGPFDDAEESIDAINWSINVSFIDILKEGAVFSVIGGQFLNLVNDAEIDDPNVDSLFDNDDESYLIEAQYKFPINDNILITPGVYVIINPNNDESNDSAWVAVVRTTFKF